MTAFGGLLFFYLLVMLLLPAVVLGLCGKRVKYYGMAVNLVFLALFFHTLVKTVLIVGFFLLQTFLSQLLLYRKQKGETCEVLVWICVLLSITPLLFAKVNALLAHPVEWIGVSYMTFRAVQVLIEIYDGLITRLNILDFYYFFLFFPSIGSGPIDRFRRFQTDMNARLTKNKYMEFLRTGVFELMTGALYNFVVAALINMFWLEKLPNDFRGVVSYMYGYTFFLFFNFAGISRMAVGTGYLLGIKTPSNFNMPFISRDLKEFWSCWHISLSIWFRDFVYTRFVRLSLQKKWFRNKYLGSYLGYILTMTVMGAWHGFALRYIVYGAYHGILMCVNDIMDKQKGFKKVKHTDCLRPVLAFVTFHIVSFGLLIFSGKLF